MKSEKIKDFFGHESGKIHEDLLLQKNSDMQGSRETRSPFVTFSRNSKNFSRKGKIFTVPFRRKRQGTTRYKKRLKLLISNKPRFVVRKSLKSLQASIIEYSPTGDKVIFTINSKVLSKIGWKGDCGNLPSAYLTGLLAGKTAIKKGINEAIIDLGFNKSVKGSRLYAALSGAIDAGLKIPFNPEVLPKKNRLIGEHIAKYAQELKGDKPRYERQFSTYLKRGINPEDIVNHFNEIEAKIHGKEESRGKD